MKKWIRFDRRRAGIGLLLGAAAFLICAIFCSWIAGIFFIGFFCFIGGLKLEVPDPRRRLALDCLWNFLFLLSTLVVMQFVIGTPLFKKLYLELLPHNLICILIPCLLLYTLCGKWRVSLFGGTLFLMLFATVDRLVYQFRGKELLFSDLMSIGTAANVASQYTFRLPDLSVYSWLFWLALCFSTTVLPKHTFAPPPRTRFVTLLSGILLMFTLVGISADVEAHTWENYGTGKNGFCLNFYLTFRDSFVQKPDTYSPDAIAQLEEAYDAPQNAPADDLPNIVIIMSEAYSDVSIAGRPARTNISVTPYFDSLQENCIKGYTLSSVFGGNTANSEFELLTSSTLGFLPNGCVPYQQYLQDRAFSLAHLANEYGYTTFATHPFLANGWSRTKIYPILGIGEYTFLEDYPKEDLIRGYVSDAEMFRYVMDRLGSADSEQPQFLFGITMQNHGGYTYSGDNYTRHIELTGSEGAYPLAEQYLSLIHESDKALEYFLGELERFPEDTIVLFFGDHLPELDDHFYEELHGGPFETLDEQQLLYTVPFFIWANYDIPEQTVGLTSLNYLGLYLLETAGLELPPFYQFQQELREVIPAMNALGYYSRTAECFLPYEEAAGEEARWLSRYELLQYNNLFDADQHSELFFGRYLPD